jgi:hypothetical protein
MRYSLAAITALSLIAFGSGCAQNSARSYYGNGTGTGSRTGYHNDNAYNASGVENPGASSSASNSTAPNPGYSGP